VRRRTLDETPFDAARRQTQDEELTSEELLTLFDQVLLGSHTYDAVHLFAPVEEDERRDIHHAELRGGLDVVVHVEFADGDFAGILAGDFFYDRSHHPARPTPHRPKIHQRWLPALDDLLLKRLIG